ncbi:MAG: hypothetical protein RLZZ09_1732 [Pseudomonadota bacterium]
MKATVSPSGLGFRLFQTGVWTDAVCRGRGRTASRDWATGAGSATVPRLGAHGLLHYAHHDGDFCFVIARRAKTDVAIQGLGHQGVIGHSVPVRCP